MKKLILAIIIIAMLGGIGYLGYMIFVSQSIKNVELLGNIQTVYMTGDEINYDDTTLKVTYNSGSIKEVSLKNATISGFSTSDSKTHGVMTIVYKDYTFKVEYNVLKHGYYYVSESYTATASGNGSPVSYTSDSTPNAVYLAESRKVLYYEKDWSDGGYTLYDGNYVDGYYYELVGDSVVVHTGETSFNIKAKYDAKTKQTAYTAEIIKVQNGLQSEKEVKTFDYYEPGAWILENRNNISLDLSKESRVSNSIQQGMLLIETSEKGYNDGNYKVFIHLKFNANNNFLKDVYVLVYDSMFNNGEGIDIRNELNPQYVHISYKLFDFEIGANLWYQVKNFV